MSVLDKVHEFFDKLENDVVGLLHTHVAQDTIATAEADGKALIAQGRDQVAKLVAEVEADVKADLATAEGDVQHIATTAAGDLAGQPAAATPVDNPQVQPTEPANPAEPAAPQG